jgi:hypothetical protein
MSIRSHTLLGVLGGAAGLVTHAVLLVRFFSQSQGLFRVFLELALAAALGLAALLVTLWCRRAPLTLAVLLPAIGVLGFLPRPLTWAAAGVLLIAAGVLAGLSARRTVPAKPGRSPWTQNQVTGITVAVILLAGVAVIVSLLSWDSLLGIDGSSSSAQSPPTTSTTLASASTHSTTTSTTAAGPATTAPVTSTTVPPVTSTTVDDGYDTYVDADWGFTVDYPSTWRNTDPSEVGPRVYGGRNQSFAKAYNDEFVAATLADWKSPTYDGCYLDFIWIEVYDDPKGESPSMDEIKSARATFIQDTLTAYPGVKLIQPIRDARIDLTTGFSFTWSFPVDRYTEVVTECILVADDIWYYLALASSEDDWKTNSAIFEKVLKSFTVPASAPST